MVATYITVRSSDSTSDANAAVTAVSVSEYGWAVPRGTPDSYPPLAARWGVCQRLPRGPPDPRELDRLGIGVAPWIVPRNR